MAKDKIPELPSLKRNAAADDAKVAVEADAAVEPLAPSQPSIELKPRTAVIEVPLGAVPAGYISRQARNFSGKRMSYLAAYTLRCIQRGAEDKGKCLLDGSPVNCSSRTLEYVLETIGINAGFPRS